MRRLGDGFPGRVDDQLGRQSRLVRHVEAGYGRARPTGALGDAPWGIAAQAAALAFPGDLQRALDLDLGEVWDGRPGEISPHAAVGGRVDDDGDAGLGHQPRHPAERPVHHIALGVGVARLRCQGLSDLVELEDAHGIAARAQLHAGRACQRRFAAAGNARDPDRPAHDGLFRSGGTCWRPIISSRSISAWAVRRGSASKGGNRRATARLMAASAPPGMSGQRRC